jgi:hypothetical protein
MPSLFSRYRPELVEATTASVDSAGSCIELPLPCRCCENEATVDAEEGRGISKPIDGRDSFSSSEDAILKAGKSRACSIDGLRNESRAWGRGRMDVASAKAVVY